MSLDLQHNAQRRMRRLWIVVVCLVGLVVVLIGMVIGLSGGNSTTTTGKGPAPAPSGTPGPSATAWENPAWVSPQKWVQLPNGASQQSGLPIKFPQTAQGAVAMIVSGLKHTWTWNTDDAVTAAGVYSLPQDAANQEQEIRDNASQLRTRFGVPGTGPLPDGASLTAWPIGVQWQQTDSTHVHMSVLMRLAHTPGSGQTAKTDLYSIPAGAVWTGGDWKMQLVPPDPHQPEPFDLGTDGFNTAGWTAIQEGDTHQ